MHTLRPPPSVDDYFSIHEEEWTTLVEWLAQHPPLQSAWLLLYGRPYHNVLDAVIELARTRPALQIFRDSELSNVFAD